MPHPVLFQLNTRVHLNRLARELGKPTTLDDIQDEYLDRLASQGIEWVWLLSVWTTGPKSREESRRSPEWQHEFSNILPDLSQDDIGGSGFAIADYRVSELLGGPKSLARLRERLAKRGIRLMLDFVPNHMGLDHAWMQTHPEYLIQASEEQMQEHPGNFFRDEKSDRIFAHGRDPYFPGWTDTVQLNYSNPDLQREMRRNLATIAGQCDGVRCDMAMLLTPRVFERTWGSTAEPFWPTAIEEVKKKVPGFVFMAEVYWDMEWELQEDGFDYCYDKRLYDRLRGRDFVGVKNHLKADVGYQRKLVRFLENHDEPRAASAFEKPHHVPAAALTFLSPGLRFFHQGEFEGKRIKISPHLVRGPDEATDPELQTLYTKLLEMLKDPIFHDGSWELLEIERAWSDNWSSDCLVAWTWKDSAGRIVLCIVNLADHEAQGTILIPDWLRAGAERSWVNRWTGDDFQMPTEDWGRGAWTLYAQPSQVFVVESK